MKKDDWTNGEITYFRADMRFRKIKLLEPWLNEKTGTALSIKQSAYRHDSIHEIFGMDLKDIRGKSGARRPVLSNVFLSKAHR